MGVRVARARHADLRHVVAERPERRLQIEPVEPGLLRGPPDQGLDARVIAVGVARQVGQVRKEQHESVRRTGVGEAPDVDQGRPRGLPAGRARCVVPRPVVFADRDRAGVGVLELLGHGDPRVREALLQGAPRADPELTQVQAARERVQLEEPGVDGVQPVVPVVLLLLLVQIVHRVEGHQHQVGGVADSLELQVGGFLIGRVADHAGVDHLDPARVPSLPRAAVQDALQLTRIGVGLRHAEAEGPGVAERQDAVRAGRPCVVDLGAAQAV